MPKRKRVARSKKLLLRKRIAERENPSARRKWERISFTKRAIESLPHPESGERVFYRDTRTPHFCLRVTRTAKTFYWEKTVRGQTERETIGRFPEINVEQARALVTEIAARYAEAAAKGLNLRDVRRARREEMTLGDLWLHFRNNRKRKIEGKDSIALEYQWKSFFKKWENKKLSEITKAKAQRMILDIRKGAPYHGNLIHAQGRAMFNHAIQQLDWKGENPFLFEMVSRKGRERSRKKDARIYDHQMPQFMKGLEACSAAMRILFLCALYTGRRVGEVQAMRWDDLDLKSGIWFVPHTKSAEPQRAMLPSNIVELLEQHREGADGPWVFPSPSKSGHVEEIKKAWAQVREASGLKTLQARDLRRTYISWAQEAGVPIASVQAQVGHADVGTTAKHYTAFTDSAQSDWVNVTSKKMIEAASAT